MLTLISKTEGLLVLNVMTDYISYLPNIIKLYQLCITLDAQRIFYVILSQYGDPTLQIFNLCPFLGHVPFVRTLERPLKDPRVGSPQGVLSRVGHVQEAIFCFVGFIKLLNGIRKHHSVARSFLDHFQPLYCFHVWAICIFP